MSQKTSKSGTLFTASDTHTHIHTHTHTHTHKQTHTHTIQFDSVSNFFCKCSAVGQIFIFGEKFIFEHFKKKLTTENYWSLNKELEPETNIHCSIAVIGLTSATYLINQFHQPFPSKKSKILVYLTINVFWYGLTFKKPCFLTSKNNPLDALIYWKRQTLSFTGDNFNSYRP